MNICYANAKIYDNDIIDYISSLEEINEIDLEEENDLLDIEEAEMGTDPLLYDTDEDGVNDKDDAYPLDPTKSKDFDGDGIADEMDEDDDNDGCLDTEDVFPFDSSECLDTDNDGIGNNQDDDDDSDGLKDVEEETQTLTNSLLYDTDGDGVNDKDDVFPLDPNESLDSDQDGLGDNADPNDANVGPIAVIYSATLIAKTGESIEFDATASIDSDGSIEGYEWDFGDFSPKQNESKVEHVYKEAGNYNVTLKVTDDKQESREKMVQMTIKKNLFYIYFLIAFGVVLVFVAGLKRFFDKEEN
jgi:hypothetical protein